MISFKKYGSLGETLKEYINIMNSYLDRGDMDGFTTTLLYYIQAFPVTIQEQIAEELEITAEDLEEYLTDPELRDSLIDDVALYIIIDSCGLEITEESRKKPIKYYFGD